jgi:hypothetical protein
MSCISSFKNRPASSPGICLRIGSTEPLVPRDWFSFKSLRSCRQHNATKMSGGVDGRVRRIIEVQEPEPDTGHHCSS